MIGEGPLLKVLPSEGERDDGLFIAQAGLIPSLPCMLLAVINLLAFVPSSGTGLHRDTKLAEIEN